MTTNVQTKKRFNVKDQLERLHIEIPKALLFEDFYKPNKDQNKKGLSNDAKILYAILQDRTLLSIYNSNKNDPEKKFTDENGDIFIYFDNISLAEILNVSEKKVRDLKKELTKFDLLEEVRQGQGQPNRLYLNIPISTVSNLKFYTDSFNQIVTEKREIERLRVQQYRDKQKESMNGKNDRTVENTMNGNLDGTSTDENKVQVPTNLPSSNTEVSKSDFSKTDFDDDDISSSSQDNPQNNKNTVDKIDLLLKGSSIDNKLYLILHDLLDNNIEVSEKQLKLLINIDPKIGAKAIETTLSNNGNTFSYFYKVYKTLEQKDIEEFLNQF